MRDWSKLAPLTERAWSDFTEADLAAIAPIDERELAAERARVSEAVAKKISTPTRSVRNRLRSWEVLVSKMESGWPPDGTYFPEEYVNELEKRDRLEVMAQELPEASQHKVRSLLDILDARFESASLADGGEAVRPWAAPQSDYAQLNWWWHRSPTNTPWRP
jgi:hypothetical protein